jgi:hypothetical protein
MTQHARHVPFFSAAVPNPCTGATGMLNAVSANEVFHVTFFTSGDEFWVTGTDEGTATFTPNDPTGISASGHFASWFGESINNKNDVQHNVFNLTLAKTDGSHVIVHEPVHLSANANGVVTVNFDKPSMSCAG